MGQGWVQLEHRLQGLHPCKRLYLSFIKFHSLTASLPSLGGPGNRKKSKLKWVVLNVYVCSRHIICTRSDDISLPTVVYQVDIDIFLHNVQISGRGVEVEQQGRHADCSLEGGVGRRLGTPEGGIGRRLVRGGGRRLTGGQVYLLLGPNPSCKARL